MIIRPLRPATACQIYTAALMNSETRSLIMMVVALVLARITSGITEALATRRPSMPWT